MATYLPSANLTPLWSFFHYDITGGVSAAITTLQTALTNAYTDLSVQVFQDTTENQTNNAVIVINDSQVISVAPGNYVGYNQGSWSQYGATDFGNKFTAYGS